jgi:hypothetical protein
MALNLDKAKAGQQAQRPSQPTRSAGAITKPVAIPALKALEHQLDTQADNLEAQARQLVQTKMESAKERVRDGVMDELAAIAGDDDFFGFGSMFDTVPILEAPIDAPEPPAGEQTIDAPASEVPV